MSTVIANIALLVIEGTALACMLLPYGSWMLPVAMSLPIAAFMNVLVVFVFTIFGIPLSPLTLLPAHFLILGVAFSVLRKNPWLLLTQIRPTRIEVQGARKIVVIVSSILLLCTFIYAVSHSILLPSNQYDSATNWTMRSQISFVDREIAFDLDESRGMAKPQYPFLFHALQVTANEGLTTWSDAGANGILLLLSILTLGALFSLLRMRRGPMHALLTITLLAGIPLFSLHLAQGYGDINLVQYLLLSLACLGAFLASDDQRSHRWLTLSGVFVAAAVWTKSEGLIFGLFPWILTVGAICGGDGKKWKSALPSVVITILLSAPWPIFAMLKGLPLTPHSSDTIFSFHGEGLSEAILGLFSRGSFGITWYAIALAVPLVFIAGLRRHPEIDRRMLPLLLAGLVTFVGFLFVYLWTPNVRYLLNAESYYRQMMLPACLLVLGCSFCIRTTD